MTQADLTVADIQRLQAEGGSMLYQMMLRAIIAERRAEELAAEVETLKREQSE
jgi:hypothetical protein